MRTLLLIALCASQAFAQTPFVVSERAASRKSTAALWTDYNGDGELDLVSGDGRDRNELYLGTGGGFVSVYVGTVGAPSTDGVFSDIDNDGDPDLLVGSLSGGGLMLNGDGGFMGAFSVLSGYRDTRGIDVLDVDGDGALDAYLARRFGSSNVLLYGDGAGRFSERSGSVGIDTNSNASCAGDVDGDGDFDVFVAGGAGSSNALLLNASGQLTPVDHAATMPGVSSTVCAWDDADGDGDVDLFVGSSGQGQSRLFLNDEGSLVEAPASVFAPVALDAFGADWGDTDNDGDLDLVVARRNGPAQLFLNKGGPFVAADVAPEATDGKFIAAASLTDYDRDGDLDLALPAGNGDINQVSLILDNTGSDGNWLQVELTGTLSNRDGIGARVEVVVVTDGEERILVRERRAHDSRRSQPGHAVHFGLGDADRVESLTVRWPSGTVQEVEGARLNEFVGVTESGVPPSVDDGSGASQIRLEAGPSPSRNGVLLRVRGADQGVIRFEAFDARGRRVRDAVRTASGGEAVATWNPRVAGGMYTSVPSPSGRLPRSAWL